MSDWPDALESFSQLLTDAMKLKQMDYRTLGKLVGVSHGYLWQLVNADKRAINDPSQKRKRPNEELTRKLAAVLEIDELALLRSAGFQDAKLELAPTGPTRYTNYATTARQLYQDGLQASAKGHTERAIALIEAALSRGGVSFVNGHAGLAMAHYQAGNDAAAIKEFDAALAAYEQEAEKAAIDQGDLHYNRGLAYQRSARTLRGKEQLKARRRAAGDFRTAIAMEGASQDLYHSALCYLWLETDHPRRILPYARSFLHRQAVGPTRHTTAALDINLFYAYAVSALGLPGGGMALVDLSLQLCPNYWFAQYVKAALLARQTGTHPRLKRASLNAGVLHMRRAIALYPACAEHFRAEREGDFKAWGTEPEFEAVLAQADTLTRNHSSEDA